MLVLMTLERIEAINKAFEEEKIELRLESHPKFRVVEVDPRIAEQLVLTNNACVMMSANDVNDVLRMVARIPSGPEHFDA